MRAMLVHVSLRVADRSDELNAADRAIGDGDHGLAMARGFDAARRELEAGDFETVGDLLTAVGRALLTTGGASGMLFAALFTGGASGLASQEHLGGLELARFLVDGTAAVGQRGMTAPGQKTMLDALAPAARIASELQSAPLDEVLPAVAEAALAGVEATKTMVASAGKAKSLGERSLGHADPGAISVHLILSAMAEYVGYRR
jgi:phosphoenolpyruvate---glycerone phosphotransferase subunit DhaL